MIGKKIKELRTARGYTLSELAEKANVAKSYLSAIERDIQKNPSIQFLEKISNVLAVPMDTFLTSNTASLDSNEELLVLNDLDEDWKKLVVEAMNSGVTKEQFKQFLEFRKGIVEANNK